MKKTIGFLLVIILGSCLSNDPLNLPFYSFLPKELGDGLVLSYPSAQNMDSASLVNIY